MTGAALSNADDDNNGVFIVRPPLISLMLRYIYIEEEETIFVLFLLIFAVVMLLPVLSSNPISGLPDLFVGCVHLLAKLPLAIRVTCTKYRVVI